MTSTLVEDVSRAALLIGVASVFGNGAPRAPLEVPATGLVVAEATEDEDEDEDKDEDDGMFAVDSWKAPDVVLFAGAKLTEVPAAVDRNGATPKFVALPDLAPKPMNSSNAVDVSNDQKYNSCPESFDSSERPIWTSSSSSGAAGLAMFSEKAARLLFDDSTK